MNEDPMTRIDRTTGGLRPGRLIKLASAGVLVAAASPLTASPTVLQASAAQAQAAGQASRPAEIRGTANRADPAQACPPTFTNSSPDGASAVAAPMMFEGPITPAAEMADAGSAAAASTARPGPKGKLRRPSQRALPMVATACPPVVPLAMAPLQFAGPIAPVAAVSAAGAGFPFLALFPLAAIPFIGGGGGTVGVTPPVPVTPEVPGVIPEPATWAMMILGFSAVGYALRRRRWNGRQQWDLSYST